MEAGHFKEELQELLDGRLEGAARAKVERHLEECTECRREFAALRWTKQFAAEHFAKSDAPADLEQNILQALRAEAASGSSAIARPDFRRPSRRAVLAWAAVIAAAAILAGSYYFLGPDLPESVVRNYRAYENRTLALERKTRDVEKLENYFAEHGVPFKAHVYDLARMDYQLRGGRVQRLHGQLGALFVYRGGEGDLLCQMYMGKAADLPAGAVRLEHNGIVFYRYEVKGVTVVFWPEGRVMCALASDIAPKKLVDLAFAKAARL